MKILAPAHGMAAALLAGAVLASAALGSEWTSALGGSWADGGNWDSPPANDGTEDILLGTQITQRYDVTLDGDRYVNSLHAVGDNAYDRYILKPGSPSSSKLILKSGNLSMDGAGINYLVPLYMQGITVQIGDGATAVTTAAWDFTNSASRNPMELGPISGISGTVVTVTGNCGARFNGDSGASYLGEFRLASVGVAYCKADNALGGGKATLLPGFGGLLFEATSSHVTDFDFDATKCYVAVNSGITCTMAGGLSGSADLDIGVRAGSSSAYTGTLVLATSGFAVSGDIQVYAGTLRVQSGLSGVGNMTIQHPYNREPSLEGTGTVGMANGKVLTVKGKLHSSVEYYPSLCPGTDGTIGTLSAGTPGNGNSVVMDEYTRMKMDLSGTTPGHGDRLIVSGSLELKTGAVSKELRLYRLDGTGLAGTYTLATYDSLIGTFDRVYYDDVLVGDPTAENAIGGTHKLVYGSTSLTLVGGAVPSGSVLMLR